MGRGCGMRLVLGKRMSKKATNIDLLGAGSISMRTVHRMWMAILSCVFMYAASLPLVSAADRDSTAFIVPVPHALIAIAVLALLMRLQARHRSVLARCTRHPAPSAQSALRHSPHSNITP